MKFWSFINENPDKLSEYVRHASNPELLKTELVEIKTYLKTLTVGFGEGPVEGGYLTGIGNETAKAVGKSKINDDFLDSLEEIVDISMGNLRSLFHEG